MITKISHFDREPLGSVYPGFSGEWPVACGCRARGLIPQGFSFRLPGTDPLTAPVTVVVGPVVGTLGAAVIIVIEGMGVVVLPA